MLLVCESCGVRDDGVTIADDSDSAYCPPCRRRFEQPTRGEAPQKTAEEIRDYEIVRGAYQGTTDDRLDRWYIQIKGCTLIDRRGAGYATKREAMADLREMRRLKAL